MKEVVRQFSVQEGIVIGIGNLVNVTGGNCLFQGNQRDSQPSRVIRQIWGEYFLLAENREHTRQYKP